MPPDALLDDEEYASEEDSDFAPDAAPADGASDASGSESEDEDSNNAKPSATTKRKRPTGEGVTAAAATDDRDDGFENSGDEAIIQKAKKRQKKARRKDGVTYGDDDDGEGGGEGGLIKTRSMRATEKAERRSHAITGPVTIDVDDLWAKMTAAPIVPAKADPQQEKDNQQQQPPSNGDGADSQNQGEQGGQAIQKAKSIASEPPVMIKIKRTYNFAGKVHTEEKLVPRESAEAKLYLASLDPNSAEAAAALAAAESGDAENDEAQLRRRQPRKAFRSAFEPVVEGVTGAGRRSDLDLGMAVRLQLREQRAAEAKAKKLNVVEKSRMDWAGFVDKEGLKDELELAGRSKESYASRQDFLARVDAHREEEARRARIAGRAA